MNSIQKQYLRIDRRPTVVRTVQRRAQRMNETEICRFVYFFTCKGVEDKYFFDPFVNDLVFLW